MTIRESILETIDMLGNIRIPAVLMEDIGIPVYNSRQNLIDCLRSIPEDGQAAAESPETPQETEEHADG